MAMSLNLKITGNTFVKVGTVARLEMTDGNVEISNNHVGESENGVVVQEPAGILQQLGLSNDTPLPLVKEILEAVAQNTKGAELQAKVESTGLLGYLAAGANIATLLTGLAQIANSGTAAAALKLLPGG